MKKIAKFIAVLIHPEKKVDNSLYFPVDNQFWDYFVKIGSSHLILPALYSAILRKNLQNFFPKDLLIYLKEIHQINSNRNSLIMHQLKFLTHLFLKNEINHVFLKGSAMIIKSNYDAKCERMLGDVDILISKNDIKKAIRILKSNGFHKIGSLNNQKNSSSIFNRHYPRLINKKYIASVELHTNLLSKRYSHLISANDMLENKVYCNGFWIPSTNHMWRHAIFNWQYNDLGIYRFEPAFSTILDVLHLEPQKLDIVLNKSEKSIKNFYSLLAVLFEEYNMYKRINFNIYQLKLNYKIFSLLIYVYFRIMSIHSLIYDRSLLFLNSSDYRETFREKFFKKNNYLI